MVVVSWYVSVVDTGVMLMLDDLWRLTVVDVMLGCGCVRHAATQHQQHHCQCTQVVAVVVGYLHPYSR